MRIKFFNGYTLAIIIALLWLTGLAIRHTNLSGTLVTEVTEYDHWIVLGLIIIAILSQLFKNRASHSHHKAW